MRVLVTGGTGFLGRHAAVRLKALGLEVAVLGRNDRVGAELKQRGIEYLKADLTDRDAVVAACAGRDSIIHSGGLASPWGKYADFYAANVTGTRNVIEGSKRHAVQRLVHVSTPSLYFDYRDRFNIKESEPLPKPTTPYAETKGLADRLIDEVFRAGLPTIAIRPRAIFGPGDQAVLVRVIRAAEKGVVPLVNGGNAFVDLTYIDNVVDALLLCLEAPASALGRYYNITNGQPIRFKAMVEMLFSHLEMKPRLRPLPFPLAFASATAMEWAYRFFRPGQEPPLTRYGVGLMAKSQTLDIGAARTELGYSPRVSLEQGMARFGSWWSTKEKLSYGEQLGL